MGYRRSILRRWSRRDWLTVVIIAVATAFLVGTTLLLLTAGTHAATVSGDLETSTTATYYESMEDAETAADGAELVFPIAVVSDGDGTKYTIIGVPPDAPDELDDATTSWDAATIPPPGQPGTVRGPVSEEGELQLEGRRGAATVTVAPHEEETIFPPWWYTAHSETVESLGPTEAVVIDTGSGITREDAILLDFNQFDRGVPLVSALAFLLAGMNEVLQVLSVATMGGAVIVMVVLYSVTRISVQERLKTIEVIRSTGATPARVLTLFGLRSTLLAFAGTLSGFLIGIGVTNLSVKLAAWVGISVTLDPTLTLPVLRVLVPMVATLVAVGGLAGVIAARPAATASPTTLRSQAGSRTRSPVVRRLEARLPSALSPTLLDWRTVVPTAATLAVFILLVLLIAGIGTAIAPLGAAGTGTITSAGAPHPIDSRLDVETANALKAEGIDASPEIVLAQVNDGQPYLARGANYSDFAAVTGAQLVEGHEPTTPNEAVIGRNLARTLDLEVGETLTLGGSDHPAVTRVTIVGVYETDSAVDDQLIVPLETAHHLSLEEGTVHIVRTAEGAGAALDAAGTEGSTGDSVVQGMNTPREAVRGEPTTVTVHVRNDGSTTVTRMLSLDVGQTTYEREVTLEPDEEDRIEIEHAFESTGDQTVAVESHSQTVAVLAPDALVLPDTLPANAPPGETLLVPVTTPTDEPVADATVAIDGEETTTDADGMARIQLPESEGQYELSATSAGRDGATHEIRVADGQERLLGADLELEPRTGTPRTIPEATVTLTNHWTDERTQEVSVVSPTGERNQPVTLAPGESRTTEQTLGKSDDQTPPGKYEIAVTADGEPIATTTYEVLDGNVDLESISGEARYQSGAALGQVIENTLGNIQLLLATMVALAGLMTIGSTTAAFAQAVHARHEAIAIHRSTGARPMRVLKIVVLDALRVAIPAVLLAAILALVAIRLLDALELLSIFGVRFATDAGPLILLVTLVGAVGIAVCSAALALVPALRSSPTAVWRGSSRSGASLGSRTDNESQPDRRS